MSFQDTKLGIQAKTWRELVDQKDEQCTRYAGAIATMMIQAFNVDSFGLGKPATHWFYRTQGIKDRYVMTRARHLIHDSLQQAGYSFIKVEAKHGTWYRTAYVRIHVKP